MSRKLDAAIAEALGKCVEWKLKCYSLKTNGYTEKDGPFINPDPGGVHQTICPPYSTDGNAMLELIREMREQGYMVTIYADKDGSYVEFGYCQSMQERPIKEYTAEADTLPEAVTLAAHYALTGKEWKE